MLSNTHLPERSQLKPRNRGGENVPKGGGSYWVRRRKFLMYGVVFKKSVWYAVRSVDLSPDISLVFDKLELRKKNVGYCVLELQIVNHMDLLLLTSRTSHREFHIVNLKPWLSTILVTSISSSLWYVGPHLSSNRPKSSSPASRHNLNSKTKTLTTVAKHEATPHYHHKTQSTTSTSSARPNP